MATSVAEINSLSLSSEILFSKNFSHIKTSQPHSKLENLRSRDFETIDLISFQLTIKFNSTEFRLYSYAKFELLVLGVSQNFQMTSLKAKADLGSMSQLRWSSL